MGNIIIYSALFFIIGIVSNIITVSVIPDEYFEDTVTTRDIGYILSIVPYVLSIPAIYFFIVGFIDNLKISYKIWRTKREIRKIMDKYDVEEMEDLSEELNKQLEDSEVNISKIDEEG